MYNRSDDTDPVAASPFYVPEKGRLTCFYTLAGVK